MNHRTTFSILPSSRKINYTTPVMFTGSCFAMDIGNKMAEGKMKVLVNPSGTIYNPVSVCNTISMVIENRVLNADDLFSYDGRYVSFNHYTDFSSDNPSDALNKINNSTLRAHKFLTDASLLFITFGTSRIYRLRETGEIVSNCHKLPGELFVQEMLSVKDIITMGFDLLNNLQSFNGDLRVVFTISPVRHWKDGAHGNQVSKSVLFVATEQLLQHPMVEGYFPAYELLMDDLRDYRYYADDMLHLSRTAVDYVWDTFTGSYFDPASLSQWKEIHNICKALSHRLSDSSPAARKEFATAMLNRISQFSTKHPDVDFTKEIDYFHSIESDPKIGLL
jgi:hypothetical protein